MTGPESAPTGVRIPQPTNLAAWKATAEERERTNEALHRELDTVTERWRVAMLRVRELEARAPASPSEGQVEFALTDIAANSDDPIAVAAACRALGGHSEGDIAPLTEAANQKRAALSAKAGAWQPIETAPKDGLYLITNGLGEVCPVQSRGGHRVVNNMVGFADWTYGEPATGWQPLPAPAAIRSRSAP